MGIKISISSFGWEILMELRGAYVGGGEGGGGEQGWLGWSTKCSILQGTPIDVGTFPKAHTGSATPCVHTHACSV